MAASCPYRNRSAQRDALSAQTSHPARTSTLDLGAILVVGGHYLRSALEGMGNMSRLPAFAYRAARRSSATSLGHFGLTSSEP
jgi:hypothetical protein